MQTATLIKTHRTKKGMTQLELAKKLGYGIPQFVSLVENGHSRAPISMCRKAVKVLGIDKKKMAEALMNDYKKQILKGL